MIGQNIDEAAALLTSGKLVAIPTETVYGLAGNALDANAVASIFSVKKRPTFNPLIIHVPHREHIRLYAEINDDRLLDLANRFMPGPMSLLLPKKPNVADIVTAGSDLVAVRVPSHPLTVALLHKLNFPVAAPSANPFGYISPTTAHHVQDQLGEHIPYILDGGSCAIGIESTIVGLDGDNNITIYRKGGLSIEEIEKYVGPVQIMDHSSSRPAAPGMLSSHYAPKTRLILGHIPTLLEEYPLYSTAILSFSTPYNALHSYTLSPSGSMQEAAANLFKILRQLDELSLDFILAELLPEQGLGRAINDRLKRAAF
jgi:L-threonylcarbamoyladenylate synthase